jgi:hypothetical protein
MHTHIYAYHTYILWLCWLHDSIQCGDPIVAWHPLQSYIYTRTHTHTHTHTHIVYVLLTCTWRSGANIMHRSSSGIASFVATHIPTYMHMRIVYCRTRYNGEILEWRGFPCSSNSIDHPVTRFVPWPSCTWLECRCLVASDLSADV